MKVWDLHCDTLYELRRAEKAGAPKSFLHNDLHIDLEKLQQGDYLLQCFAAYVDLADPAPGADPLVSVLEEIDIFKRLMAAYPEKIAPVYTAADLERNRAEGKLSAMLTVEEGGCCKGSLGVLRRLQELGVRMMTLTWNYPNELAAPNANPGGPLVANTETGLTERGFAFLEEMEKLHITADVSHLSDKGFWDIANHSTRPFAASHSNCRALCDVRRNLSDDQLRPIPAVDADIFQSLFNHLRSAVVQYFDVVSIIFQDISQNFKVNRQHCRNQDGMGALHLLGKGHLFDWFHNKLQPPLCKICKSNAGQQFKICRM